jgi:hypothetical protein
MSNRALAVLAALFAISFSDAQAATAVCKGMSRDFSLTTSVAANCVAVAPLGAANISGNPDNDPLYAALGSTLRLLDKSDDSISGTSNGALAIALDKTGKGLSGSFTLDLTKIVAPAGKVYTSFILAFKSGGNSSKGSIWAAFALPMDILSGTWAISGQNALSHANLYAYETTATPPSSARPAAAPELSAPVPVVPVPASWSLLLAGLGGLGLLGRRRARQSA